MVGANTALNYKLYCLPDNSVNISLQVRLLVTALAYGLLLVGRLYSLGKNIYTPIISQLITCLRL